MQKTASPQAHVFGSEEAFARIAIQLMETDKLHMMSDITAEEINILTSLQTLSDFLGSKIIDKLINYFLLFRISKERKGRNELSAVALASRDEGGRRSKSLGSLFAGLR